MTNTNISAGQRVTANGGLTATVISVKGRWVKVQFDHDNSEKNVGFKDVTPIVEVAAEKTKKNGVVDYAARARYTTTRMDGLLIVDNGDDVAQMLRGMELDDVFEMASKKLNVEENELRAKYGHLNAGMQRMNLGNRIRKAFRDADKAYHDQA